jgi:alanine dehydrogenase
MSTLLLDKRAVNSLLNMKEVLNTVEQAFKMWGEGKGNMPPKAYLTVENGDFRAMPASLPGHAGMKWVNAHPGNRSHNLPSVMAVLVYNDPETGYPLAIMDATNITAYRTGAAAAIASKYLARPDSRSLGIIGAGTQAHTQIRAHMELFNLNSVNAFDISTESVEKLASDLPEFPIKACTIEEAATSDILCTLTPSRKPVVMNEWISAGTHINAVGADAAGKEELDPQILKRAIVIVDDIKQSTAGGEINVPIQKGIYSINDIHGTLADLVLGKIQGRTNSQDVTVFDSTGIAIEDIAVAGLIYEKARQSGGYPTIDLV